jgi:hypothetical protein
MIGIYQFYLCSVGILAYSAKTEGNERRAETEEKKHRGKTQEE